MKISNIQIKRTFFYIIIFLVFFTSSCKEKIDIKLKETYVRLVIDGGVTDETKRHTVKISETSNYFSGDAQPKVSGAVVTISDGVYVVTLTETSAGIYQTDSTYKGDIGKTYTLNIKYKNEEYISSSLLKQVSPVDSISFGNDPFDPQKSTVNLWALEPATMGDYYLWNYYINGTLMSDSIKKISFASDEMVNGNYMYGYPVYTIKEVLPGDSVTLEMRSITKEYYIFINALFSEVYGAGNPFSGPPSNVKGNVINVTNKEKDVMGFFIASAVSKKSKKFN
jgi:hypothetical protein